ncbi:MAG: hypothetical protein U1F11_14875 [Steroidobacteraceae bacterium]
MHLGDVDVLRADAGLLVGGGRGAPSAALLAVVELAVEPPLSTLASTLTARWPSKRASASFEHTSTAAAPSLIGEHIGSVSGQAMILAARISSMVKSRWNCASGLWIE